MTEYEGGIHEAELGPEQTSFIGAEADVQVSARSLPLPIFCVEGPKRITPISEDA